MKTGRIIIEFAAADKDFTEEQLKSIQSEILSHCKMMFRDNGFVFDLKEEVTLPDIGIWGYSIKKEQEK